MWEQDWALLGIEPTTELGAIKKAYALKLKVTRPDEDADGYQALRGAYERAQQWLKGQQQDAARQAAEPVAEVAVQLPELAPPDEPLPTPEPVVQPRHLIDELELRWHRAGEPALLDAWATARCELDQQPLSRQAEFSAAFAQWVLGTPALPDDFLKALNSHFGWLDDFRTERQLGTALAHALHEALDARLRPAALPEAVRELAAPLRAISALRGSPRAWWRLPWLFFLLQPLLARHQYALGKDWLQRLGLSHGWLARCGKRSLFLRIGVATALCWGVGFALFRDPIIALGHAATWLFLTGLFLVGSVLAGAFIGVGPTLTTAKGRRTLPLQQWRRHRSQPWLGIVWVLFAAWLAYMDTSQGAGPPGGVLSLLPPWAWEYTAWGFAIAGLLVAWPLDTLRGCVVVGLAPLVGYFVVAALGAWLPLPSCGLIGAAWMLVAAAVHEERFELPNASPLRWLLRPMLNSLALVDHWSFSVALFPLALCAAWAVLTDQQAEPIRLLAIWVLGILATGWLQARADAWGLRQLKAAAPS